jgi:hypothetical protein
MNSFEPGAASRSAAAGIRTTKRSLILLFAGGLLALCTANAVQAENGTAAIARAVLYNENPANSTGDKYEGTVRWRADRVKTVGQPDEIVVHADIDIPDVHMTMAMDFKRNTDKSLPASHLVELKFAGPHDAADSEVISVPGLLLKFDQTARGTPFAGLSVKVTKGMFLVGLSNVATDRTHNLQLLAERRWIDIPMVYASQHRGILAIEKGYEGEEIFHQAMQAWEQP